MQTRADLVVVGAGPAGSAAAAWAARAGIDVLVIDSATFPRDKACGDGLTPRAVAELERLGLGAWLDTRIRHRGLRMSGFGGELEVDWPGPSFPSTGSAVARMELDDRIRKVAEESGARMLLGAKAVGVHHDSSRRVVSLTLADGTEVGCRQLIVADGARSSLGRKLGRRWHQETAYGVAARGYLSTDRSDDPWLTSHLELRSPDGAVLPGYGWIFPLGNGEVNIGVGALSTSKRPADLALRPLISYYTDLRRDEWGFAGEPRAVSSALLPMGGAVSGVAGPNWMLIGDAAACVNPLNGEGIDYGLETGRLAAEMLGAGCARPVARLAVAAATALRSRVFGRAPTRAVADLPAVPADDRTDRDALPRVDDDRRAGDGQPGHRRRRGLGGAAVAWRWPGVAPARSPTAVQLRISRKLSAHLG